jgi:hypothetical protein
MPLKMRWLSGSTKMSNISSGERGTIDLSVRVQKKSAAPVHAHGESACKECPGVEAMAMQRYLLPERSQRAYLFHAKFPLWQSGEPSGPLAGSQEGCKARAGATRIKAENVVDLNNI